MVALLYSIFLSLASADAQMVDTIMVETPRLSKPPRAANDVTEVLPQRLIDRMLAADSVVCYLLCDEGGSPCGDKLPYALLEPYGIRKSGGTLSIDEQKTLLSMLTNPESYLVFQTAGVTKPCICRAHIAYVFLTYSELFRQHADPIAVIVCHDCAVIYVRGLGSRIKCDIDYSGKQFYKLSLSLFPEDPLTVNLFK